MKIQNKFESLHFMKKLGLNFFDEQIISVNDIDSIQKFMNKNKAEEYCMRSATEVLGKYFFVKNLEDVKKKLKFFEREFILDVSWDPYKNHIVLLGDVFINKDTNCVCLTARDDIEANHRNIYENPKYNMVSKLDDDKLWNIQGFEKVCNYIVEHNLYNLIVEFVVYDIPLGCKKENVVIAELRSEY